MRRRQGLFVLLGLTLSVAAWIAGCGERAPSPEAIALDREVVATDPLARLGELLRRGAQPEALEPQERREVEVLLPHVLPETTGELAGHRWRIAYIALPRADFVAVDLMQGEGDTAPRAAWIHLFYRAPHAAPKAPYPGRLGPYPARSEPGELLFVQAGNVEVRAVAESEELKQPGGLERLVESFDLDQLAQF